MRLSKEEHDEIVRDLKHWGHVARRRWRAERRQKHPLTRIQELGRGVGPPVYQSGEPFEFETDSWFLAVNQTVMQLDEPDRALLVAHYMDGKDWKMLRKMMGLRKWWEVGRELKAAEKRYFSIRILDTAVNTAKIVVNQ